MFRTKGGSQVGRSLARACKQWKIIKLPPQKEVAVAIPTKRFCVLDRWSLTRGGCAWRFDMYKGQKTTRKFPPTSRTFFYFYIPRNRAVRLLAVLSKLIPRLFSLSSSRLSLSGIACSRKAAFRWWGASWIVRGENKLGKIWGGTGVGTGTGDCFLSSLPWFFPPSSTSKRRLEQAISTVDFRLRSPYVRQLIVFDYNYKLYSSLVFSLTESLH